MAGKLEDMVLRKFLHDGFSTRFAVESDPPTTYVRLTTTVATAVVDVASVKKRINSGPGAGIEVTDPGPPGAPGPVPPEQTPVVVTVGAGDGYGGVSYGVRV